MAQQHTYIIAEAGVNHNGSVDMARELVDVAASAGADAVKFQTFRAERLVGKTAQKAEYQKQTTGSEESQFAMIKKLELDLETHRVLQQHCRERGIEFLSTPFDMESVDLLAGLGVSRMKVPSGEITNALLMLKIAGAGLPVILSTGMSTLGEVEQALAVLAFGFAGTGQPSPAAFAGAYVSDEGQEALRKHVTLLHCTTEYPAPFADVNLRAMDTLHTAFGLPVGYSDHTEGIAVPIAAVALGAQVVEKHFTLDRTLPGPDHKASLEPAELAAMVRSIREVEQSLGSPLKAPAASELKNMSIARRSLVAACPIAEGEVFTEDNLVVKRPGNGMSPMLYWQVLGTTAQRSYAEDELIGGK